MSDRQFHKHDHLGAESLAVRQRAAAQQGTAIDTRADEPREAQELLKQLREVNERLVLATLRSQELAEEADDARALVALSELRFRSLVNTIAAIVWSADANGRVRFDRAQWRVLTGLEAGELPGEWDWLEAVHVGDRERVRATWAASLASGCAYDCEHRLRLRDGSTAWVQARAVPIPGNQGPVREWMGMMADITDRKLVEEARERFIGVLGHDLRTPLTAIDMSAEQLESSNDLSAGHLRTVDLIGRCSRRMRRMIEDVLDFARGRLGGGIPLVLKPAHFGQICHATVTELLAAHPTRTIIFAASGDLAGVWDVDRVEQVVSNLVGNALEHGVDPVRVTVSGEGGDIVLAINNQNRGAPIPAELLPLIFEPFQRGASDGSPGLGLGLYIVSEIVRAHGGSIAATSSEKEGTTFTSRWSRRLPRQAPPPARPWPAPPSH